MSLDTAARTHANSAERSKVEEPSKWSALRPVIMRMHFFAGMLVAPFILIAAITGLMYTVTPQVEQFVYRDQLQVEAGPTSLPLSQQVEAARVAHPDGDVMEVDPSEATDRSTRVVFSDETVPDDYAMSVFVNPHTGEILGEVKSFGQWLGVRAWVDELHRNLHLGAVGRHYSEMAASWTWVLVLGGVTLWLTKRRRTRNARSLLVADKTKGGRAGALSWHGATGIWLLAGLLILSASGLTWSRYTGANIGEVRNALSWTTPSINTSLMSAMDHNSASHDHSAMMAETAPRELFDAGAGIDGAYAAAQAQNLKAPLFITPPAAASEAWTVGENKRSWPTSYDTIAVDGQTGAVIDRVNFDDWPFMAKLTDWIIGGHMGILFGVVNQLLLAALAIGLITVILLGYRMWWLRRPTRNGKTRMPPALAPRSLGRLPKPVLAVVVIVTVAVGFLVPLLGLSLLAFVVIDGAVSWRQRNRPTLDLNR